MSFFKGIWKNGSKHKKLSEDQSVQIAKEIENENDIIESVDNEKNTPTYKLKYLGSSVVENKTAENINSEAVKSVLKLAKAAKKKIQRVNLTVSPKEITVRDLEDTEIFQVSIYRTSHISIDTDHRQIFSFVSTSENGVVECHVFQCSKRRMAENITLAITQAFTGAYDFWRDLPAARELDKKTSATVIGNRSSSSVSSQGQSSDTSDSKNSTENLTSNNVVEVKLIDFDDEPVVIDELSNFIKPPCGRKANNPWVCFEDHFVTEAPRNGFNLIMT